MDHYSRFIGLIFVIAWTIFRLVRYLSAGATKRPATAVPPSGGVLPQVAREAAPAAAPASPIEPVAGGAGLLGGLAAVLVLLLGTAAVWGCLFLLPQLDAMPVVPRLVLGVLANFYLLYLARAVAAWARRQSGPRPPAGGNPIS